jgi:hypothetical protein
MGPRQGLQLGPAFANAGRAILTWNALGMNLDLRGEKPEILTVHPFSCEEGPRSTAALRLIVQPYDEDEKKDDNFFFFQVMEHGWNEIDRGKTCTTATLSTTNPTWAEP